MVVLWSGSVLSPCIAAAVWNFCYIRSASQLCMNLLRAINSLLLYAEYYG
jgi:hypothetical protein